MATITQSQLDKGMAAILEQAFVKIPDIRLPLLRIAIALRKTTSPGTAQRNVADAAIQKGMNKILASEMSATGVSEATELLAAGDNALRHRITEANDLELEGLESIEETSVYAIRDTPPVEVTP